VPDNDDAYSEVDSLNRDSNRQQKKTCNSEEAGDNTWNSALHMVLL